MNNITANDVQIVNNVLTARAPIIQPTAADMSTLRGVTRIGVGAFAGSTGLTGALVLPPTITHIEANAFQGCVQL